MAESDETGNRRMRIDFGGTNQNIDLSEVVNGSIGWYLERTSQYPVRNGNYLEPYYSGEEVFQAIANSIRAAKKSVDIVMWGFDPAIPIVRSHATYRYNHEVYEARLIRSDVTHQYSPWRLEDAYGEIILNALADKDRPDLKIRMVIWYHGFSHWKAKNIIGIKDAFEERSIDRDEKSTGFDPRIFSSTSKATLKGLALRQRHPNAAAYSKEWFQKVRWTDFPGRDRLAVTFRDFSNWNGSFIIREEDNITGTESGTMSYPTDHQKMILVDYEDDENRHGYVMGHNSITSYWSEFPFVHRDIKSEMDHRPYHDFSMKIKGPLTIDLNRNFCDAWNPNRVQTISDFYSNIIPLPENPTRKADRSLISHSLLEQEAPAVLLEERQRLEAHILSLPAEGSANGQIVRTRPDHRFEDDGNQEKEIKDAYLQAMRHAHNYILIVNQYCQYTKLIRHLKFWRRRLRENGLEGTLYVLIGTCKPEQDGQLFQAQQMANELGVGEQFSRAVDQIYDAESMDENGNKARVEYPVPLSNAHVSPNDLKDLKIEVLFFMFHTQIPQTPRMIDGVALREDIVAQQPYVHAKLMIEDDVFFTLGSANLNIRSMAVDSELNLISDHQETGQKMRHKLFSDYTEEKETIRFPNKIYDLSQGVPAAQYQEDMKATFAKFADIAELNSEKIKSYKRIQGYISKFEDGRSALGMRVA